MINMFIVRKWAALLLTGLFTTIGFFVGLKFYGFMWALAIMLICLLVISLMASLMLKNPFTDMLEGKGILVINMDSTGILRLYLVGLRAPYIKGKSKAKHIDDVWDRSTVAQIAAPKGNRKPTLIDRLLFRKVKMEYAAEKIMSGPKKGGLKIEISEQDYNDSRFALFHWPVLIWNDQIKSLLTKEWLANAEKETFAEHGILYLNRKVEELTAILRDFGRYVVELIKPKESIWAKSWVWIVVIVLVALIVIMFIPGVLQSLSKLWGGAQGTVQSATVSPITPR